MFTGANEPSVCVVRSCPRVCSLMGKCPDPQASVGQTFSFLFFWPNIVFLVKEALKQPDKRKSTLCSRLDISKQLAASANMLARAISAKI